MLLKPFAQVPESTGFAEFRPSPFKVQVRWVGGGHKKVFVTSNLLGKTFFPGRIGIEIGGFSPLTRGVPRETGGWGANQIGTGNRGWGSKNRINRINRGWG